ncbi:MAG: 50S ribosomal protein L14e [Nanoarchaeota archaeon]
MIEKGIVALRIAGRKAGTGCVIIDVLDKNYVLVDDGLKRKKCNISHIELTGKKASHGSTEEVAESLRSLGFKISEKREKKAAIEKQPSRKIPAKKAKK